MMSENRFRAVRDHRKQKEALETGLKVTESPARRTGSARGAGFHPSAIMTYNEGVVERSIDAGDSEDLLVGEDVLGTERDDLLSLGGLGGGLRFSLASLLIRNRSNVSTDAG